MEIKYKYMGSVKKINLIVPVHNGGILFKNALANVMSLRSYFSRVIISVNNTIDSADFLFAEETIKGQDVILLNTKKILNSGSHLRWILKNSIIERIENSEMFLLLAHDDFLFETELRNFLISTELDETMCVLGKWRSSTLMENIGNTPVFSAGFDKNTTPQEWVKSFGFSGFFTNMSGMIISKQVLLDYAKYSKFSSGARFEYMLATHRSILKILEADEPYVFIYSHPDQGGKKISQVQYGKDEILFRIWLILQGRKEKCIKNLFYAIYIYILRLVSVNLRKLYK